MKRNWITLMLLCGTLVVSAGCFTQPKMNGVKTLTDHSQFPKAAQAAPVWTKAALRKVAELEYEIERR